MSVVGLIEKTKSKKTTKYRTNFKQCRELCRKPLPSAAHSSARFVTLFCDVNIIIATL